MQPLPTRCREHHGRKDGVILETDNGNNRRDVNTAHRHSAYICMYMSVYKKTKKEEVINLKRSWENPGGIREMRRGGNDIKTVLVYESLKKSF